MKATPFLPIRLVVLICLTAFTMAQQTAPTPATSSAATVVPNVINYSGVLTDFNGKALSGIQGVTFLLYDSEQGGAPLWMETQNVTPGTNGQYTATLGSTTSQGLPAALFANGEARWLAVQVAGQTEQPRVLLVSAPYALKAADAQTLGGFPPSAFVMAAPAVGGAKAPVIAGATGNSAAAAPALTADVTTTGGTVNTLPLWTTSTNIQSSAVTQTGSGSTARIGIGTNAPAASLHVVGNGLFTGSAGTVGDARIDYHGLNKGSYTPAIRFGNGNTGEAISSDRAGTVNVNGIDLYTDFLPRMSVTNGGLVGIGTTAPANQLDIYAQSNTVNAINVVGFSAPFGSSEGGGAGGVISGGSGDQSGGTPTSGGNGLQVFGGSAGCASEGIACGLPGAGISGVGGSAGPVMGGYGVQGTGGSSGGIGVQGYGNSNTSELGPDGSGGSFQGGNASADGDGIDGFAGSGYAGNFTGDVSISGNLSKSSGSFKIDHPLDPANEYLYHSFVESPDMMNVYNGNIVLDSNGEAVVEFPKWFGALNREFRYQLTCIGGFAPVYVAEEISNNRFRIAGGKAGLKISWQVTGIRQDAWANAHRIPVEEEKSARERGFYIHPELYGAPPEKQIEWARHPLMMKRMQETQAKQLAASQRHAAPRK